MKEFSNLLDRMTDNYYEPLYNINLYPYIISIYGMVAFLIYINK